MAKKPVKRQICLSEDEADHLVGRLEAWVDYTESEMQYLRKNIAEIKEEIGKMKKKK